MTTTHMPRRLRRDPTGDGRDLAPAFGLEARDFGLRQRTHALFPATIGVGRNARDRRARHDVLLGG
jgi:hypothetical protein